MISIRRLYVNGVWRKFGEREGQNWKNLKARRGDFRDLSISDASSGVRERERVER